MTRYLIRRFLFMVLVLWIVSVLTFIIFIKLPPGDPALRAGHGLPHPVYLVIRHSLGLDRPWYVQYGRFARGLIPWPGFFLDPKYYYSWQNSVPVKEEIFGRLPVTVILAMGAAVFWLLIGIPIGIISAIRRGKFVDRAAMLLALFGVSAPDFWLAYLFLFVFWFKLRILPPSGIPIGMSDISAMFHGVFLLPWLTLSSTFAAFYARMTRSNLIESMTEDYIRTARAKGLSERRVIFKHGLRAAVTPVVTMFGMDLGFLLGGAVIAETVFALPGVGNYAILSLQSDDFPATMGVTIFAAFFIVTMNLVVDVLYAFLDPRVRYS